MQHRRQPGWAGAKATAGATDACDEDVMCHVHLADGVLRWLPWVDALIPASVAHTLADTSLG